MSGEKRAVADPSWEFTVGLVRGILIGTGIVRGRSCVGGRQAACWEKAEGEWWGGWQELQGWEQVFWECYCCCVVVVVKHMRKTGSPCCSSAAC